MRPVFCICLLLMALPAPVKAHALPVPEAMPVATGPAVFSWSVGSLQLRQETVLSSAMQSADKTASPEPSLLATTGDGPAHSAMVLEWRDFSWPQWQLFSSQGHLRCPGQIVIYPRTQCQQGHLQATVRYGKQDLTLNYPLQWSYDALTGHWHTAIQQDGSRLRLSLSPGSSLNLEARRWPVGELLRWAGRVPESGKSSLSSLDARLSGHWRVPTTASNLKLGGDFSLDSIDWESDDGYFVLANVGMHGQIRVRQTRSDRRAAERQVIEISHGRLDSGEALLGDFYFNFAEQPLLFSLKAFLGPGGKPEKALLHLAVPGVLSSDFTLSDFTAGGLPESQFVRFQVQDMEALNRLYLKDFLALKGLADARLSGQVAGELRREHNRWHSADVFLTRLDGEVPARKLQASALVGELHWRAEAPVPPSSLSWESLLLAGLPVKASGLGFFFAGDSLRFPDHSYLPVFDGALVVDHLFVSHVFSPAIDIDFSGEIEPVSLALITQKLGWPVMHGTIAGKIPGMHKKGEQIVFDGVIDVAVFDGQLKISHLAMERLFGVAPVIAADIVFNGLNLKQITTTFDFGEITGLVAGSVAGLRITNWKTDRMDAEIHSVRRKGIKQTLSQKALDRISSLGGVQGAISRSFLRFFKRFRYRRLGMRCRLRREVCEMGGIREFNGGYLLVEGGGLPRVNIIGYQRFIDWEEFLDRLLNRDYTDATVK